MELVSYCIGIFFLLNYLVRLSIISIYAAIYDNLTFLKSYQIFHKYLQIKMSLELFKYCTFWRREMNASSILSSSIILSLLIVFA